MKKYILLALILSVIFLVFPRESKSDESLDQDFYQVIPDEAIRLRILANSDHEADQQLKRKIRDEVSEQISGWVEQLTDIEEARELIEARMNEVHSTVASVLEKNNNNSDIQVEYGKNVAFPMKLYDSFIYPAGEYEAVLITIGEGKGFNWWCVLFPPLCFLDFSSGATVSEGEQAVPENTEETEEKEVKVKFFLFEWLGWA